MEKCEVYHYQKNSVTPNTRCGHGCAPDPARELTTLCKPSSLLGMGNPPSPYLIRVFGTRLEPRAFSSSGSPLIGAQKSWNYATTVCQYRDFSHRRKRWALLSTNFWNRGGVLRFVSKHAGFIHLMSYIGPILEVFSPSGSLTILVFRIKRDGDTQTGTPLTGASNERGYEKITIFDQYLALSRKWWKIDPKLLWKANGKPYPSFRMVPVWMTSSDL